jgi:hypothetical protein
MQNRLRFADHFPRDGGLIVNSFLQHEFGRFAAAGLGNAQDPLRVLSTSSYFIPSSRQNNTGLWESRPPFCQSSRLRFRRPETVDHMRMPTLLILKMKLNFIFTFHHPRGGIFGCQGSQLTIL